MNEKEKEIQSLKRSREAWMDSSYYNALRINLIEKIIKIKEKNKLIAIDSYSDDIIYNMQGLEK